MNPGHSTKQPCDEWKQIEIACGSAAFSTSVVFMCFLVFGKDDQACLLIMQDEKLNCSAPEAAYYSNMFYNLYMGKSIEL